MMTWGTIEGEPQFLGVTKFKIQETSQRDEIGMKLANKTQAKKREEKMMQKQ